MWRHSLRFPSGLAGDSHLRLPEKDLAINQWLQHNLRLYSDTFVTMPGLNSLYPWTGKEPPTRCNTTTWMTLLDTDQQEPIVHKPVQHPIACAVRNEELTQAFCVRGQSIDSMALVRFINQRFKPIGRVGSYEFLVRRKRNNVEPTYSVRLLPLMNQPASLLSMAAGDLGSPFYLQHRLFGRARAFPEPARVSIRMPAMAGQTVDHISIRQLNTDRVLWISAASATGIALDQPRCLAMFVLLPKPLVLDKAFPVVRLLDRDSRLIASVPLVQPAAPEPAPNNSAFAQD